MVSNYLNYIGGRWTESSTGEKHEHFNPAKPSESIGFTQVSSIEDVKEAVQQAKVAFSDWKQRSSVERGEILRKAADFLEENVQEIAEIATKEMANVS